MRCRAGRAHEARSTPILASQICRTYLTFRVKLRQESLPFVVQSFRFIETSGTQPRLPGSGVMELREMIGYLCLLLALAGTAGGIWAAWYYSSTRSYARLRMRERRGLRRVRAGS
jgi:hypothetical protein